MYQSGGKPKKPMSSKKKAQVNKMRSSPLAKLWRDVLKEVRVKHPNLSFKEQLKKAKPIYQKAKANAQK